MPSRLIGLFVEDFAQEQFIGALTRKLIEAQGFDPIIRSYVSRGGRPAVLSELRGFFQLQAHAAEKPDYIVVGNDGNCQGLNARRAEVERYIPDSWKHRVILAIPDPHIEAWFLRDLPAFHRAVGPCGAPPQQKCSKGVYKEVLKKSTNDAVGVAPLDGIENAQAIVFEQDVGVLLTSGADLRNFIGEVRAIV